MAASYAAIKVNAPEGACGASGAASLVGNLNDMKVSRRKLLFGLSIVILAVLCVYPWKQVVVVPEMRLRVLDESGNPAPGAVVKQKWEYRAIGSTEYQEISKADENGYVSFPERTERISLLRLVPSYARDMIHLPHGYGFGPSIVVWAYGADPHVWHYVPFRKAGNRYRNKYINLMAKTIYPMVKEYIESQRPIDQSFVDNYVRIYDDDSAVFSEPGNIMAWKYVLSDHPQDVSVIGRKLPSHTMTQYEAISASSVARMGRAPITKVILISGEDKRKLQLIKEGFAELDRWKPNAGTDITYSVLLKDKTCLIVINSVRKTAGEQLETLELK